MKIDGYGVMMNMEHFGYRSASLQASGAVSANENFKSGESPKTDTIERFDNSESKEENVVIKELSASLLKSISNKTRVQDTFRLSATYVEAEALNFQTKAYVKSGDKEIALELNVSLSRSFVQQMSIESVKALQDPLIVELNGSFPSLSSKTFAFDIDSDGKEDQISMLGRSSAFLALDKNSNGVIDDGSELFGTKSGNGFEELRAYDDDKNGWIDENDKIFNKLRIWRKSEGRDELVALGEVGIGAIFLGNIATPFELKSSSNTQLGVMRKSGFFLFESGKAGVISQIDLAVSQIDNNEINLLIGTKESFKRVKGIKLYKNESNENEDSMDKRFEKLQKLLKSLEAKLNRASDEEKAPLQAQIGAVYSQMMSLISKKL
ncbi:MAG: hypothetical protein A2513_07215 [Sulfurimonas sp. RIFOXYD12_FULL_33_39]|uniref:hypothetical protein n=1 Tax=unclassified Sulfurimonas TaxID=2623549 RepID=UPI0008BF90D6|nr:MULTISPECIES: hypothetical protein [unclassified Sulfurimonas]OHE09079.1 MAG: hypothetical protein A2513_07215 [Sulfurimonas sp. RIFOXYD12_FULL_33_39]OHE14396.1 MAG: hypothetical protein A2530_10285 [Sulfurimonas sp. RIFOXYD2_FULL_34_21]